MSLIVTKGRSAFSLVMPLPLISVSHPTVDIAVKRNKVD
jgi:hypothetical protein